MLQGRERITQPDCQGDEGRAVNNRQSKKNKKRNKVKLRNELALFVFITHYCNGYVRCLEGFRGPGCPSGAQPTSCEQAARSGAHPGTATSECQIIRKNSKMKNNNDTKKTDNKKAQKEP